LAAHTCWQLWAERNSATFENRPPSVSAVLHRILSNFQWQASSIKTFPHKICDITLAVGHTLACFDGAASSNGLCCGAGGFFKSHPRKITKWFLCCGEGTNTKAELLGLWATLTLASLWSINQLFVLGDSRIVIDWASQKSSLHSVSIESWLEKTRALSSSFTDINFLHISREHNRVADELSKRALGETVGRLSVFHSDNGIDSSISTYNFFE
jgi:ribonuclease HI